MNELTQGAFGLRHVGGADGLVSLCWAVALHSRRARHALSSVAKSVQCDHRQEAQEEPQEEGR